MEDIFKEIESEGHAKQSGWQHHYQSLSKIKDECLKFATLSKQGGAGSIDYLKAFVNHSYSFASQILCFYPLEIEDKITEEYMKMVKSVNVFISDVQEGFATSNQIPEELSLEISKFFSKLMRLAQEKGLLIDSENLDDKEPIKGALGLDR